MKTYYKQILSECEARNLFCRPEKVKIDFQAAIIKAMKAVLNQQIEISNCFNHFTQSIFRKIQFLGLSTEYRIVENLSTFCGILNRLLFFSVSDVQMSWYSILIKLASLVQLGK